RVRAWGRRLQSAPACATAGTVNPQPSFSQTSDARVARNARAGADVGLRPALGAYGRRWRVRRATVMSLPAETGLCLLSKMLKVHPVHLDEPNGPLAWHTVHRGVTPFVP